MSTVANRTVERALRRAVLGSRLTTAPRTEPAWSYRLRHNTLEMFLDPRHGASPLEPHNRAALLECGAALLTARAVIARDELTATVTRFPDGPDDLVFARLVVHSDGDPDEWPADQRLAPLCDYLRMVRLDSGETQNVDVPRAFATKLAAAAAQEDVLLVRVARADHLAALHQMHRQVEHLLGDVVEPWPLPEFAGQGTAAPRALPAQRNRRSIPTLLLLGTRDDGPLAWLRSGEALQRVRLELAREGAGTRPLTALLSVPAARAALRRGLSLDFHPQVLFRVVKAPNRIEPF